MKYILFFLILASISCSNEIDKITLKNRFSKSFIKDELKIFYNENDEGLFIDTMLIFQKDILIEALWDNGYLMNYHYTDTKKNIIKKFMSSELKRYDKVNDFMEFNFFAEDVKIDNPFTKEFVDFAKGKIKIYCDLKSKTDTAYSLFDVKNLFTFLTYHTTIFIDKKQDDYYARLIFKPDSVLYYIPLRLSFFGKDYKYEMGWIYDRDCSVLCTIIDKDHSDCDKMKSLLIKVEE
jgi:hypothetical protein